MTPIALFHLRLDAPPLPPATLATFLTSDEMTRANRFVFEADRRRFITARGWLRWQLAQAARIEPDAVRFSYGTHGKPYLPDVSDLRFNLAHSGEHALLGLAWGRTIGVDIEQMRPLPDLESIVTSFFSLQEQVAILAQPPGRRPDAFFTLWTCKEAYLKALGDGLARPLDSFTIGLEPVPYLHSVVGDMAETGRWQIERVAVGEGYKAAVCYQR